MIQSKTWNDFEIECRSKKLILYGLGTLLNHLFIRCSEFEIVAAIDNDVEKQGHYLKDFFDESDLQSAQNIIIESKESLKKYNPNEIVILISTIRYTENIVADLESQNFFNNFSVLHMNNNSPLDNDYVADYAQECVKNYPINQNKIIFGGMDRYPDHGKAITEKLLAMNPNLDIVWLVNTPFATAPDNVRVLYEGKWKQFIYEMETAKFLILNMALRVPIIKRDNQIYIMMKHWGSVTLKTFYFYEENANYEREIWNRNFKMIDYMIVGSDFDEKTCRHGFNFHGECLRFGSPRSDILFDTSCKKKIYEKFKLTDEKILLYAPTFRANTTEHYEEINFDLLIDTLKHKFKCEWKIFLRLHPSVKVRNKIDNPNVIDVSKYEGSQELVSACEIMLTDYSSIMFEPAYIVKPVFLFAPDKDNYIKNERELLIDYDTLPFPISTTNEELSEQIKIFDENKYKQTVKNFLDEYGVHEDGHASERVAKFIVELLKE